MNTAFDAHKDLIIKNIINEISSLLPGGISPLDNNSEEQFYEYVKYSPIDRSAFSYNWPYVIQATRGCGFYYQNEKAIVYFYLRENTSNPQTHTLIIVNHLGHNSEINVCKIVAAAKRLNIASIVKNIDRDKIPFWNNLGFTETIVPWSDYSFRDDNTFSEFVYDIKKFINLKFSGVTKAIIKKITKENKYVFVPYDKSFENQAIKLLEKNAEYLANKGVDFQKNVILAHEFIFDDRIKKKAIFAVLENNNLIAVTFMTHVEDNLFFNAIISENKSNLMRFLLWASVVHYYNDLEEDNKKPQYLALQGSENEGQNRWKNFFRPERAIYRTHMANESLN
jgi:hypothetical protein